MAANPAAGVVIFVVMFGCTFWIGNIMLKAVDVLYKPMVKRWMLNRPMWHEKYSSFYDEGIGISCKNYVDKSNSLKIDIFPTRY